MEEITIRFEIVRLAVKMADHETIGIQAQKLREISLDEDLNEIIALLESRNYRQGLYLMKGYMSSLDDSFFTPKPAPAPPKQTKPEPQSESQNLFDMMQPKVTQTINLDDMLRMTDESAGETVSYQEAESLSETYIAHTKEEVEKNEAYLDIHKNRVENKTILSKVSQKKETQEVLYNPLEERSEVHQPKEIEGITPAREQTLAVETKTQKEVKVVEQIVAEERVLKEVMQEEAMKAEEIVEKLAPIAPAETIEKSPIAPIDETLEEISIETSDTETLVVEEVVTASKETLQETLVEVDSCRDETIVDEPAHKTEEWISPEVPEKYDPISEESIVEITEDSYEDASELLESAEAIEEPREIIPAEDAVVQEIDIAIAKPKQSLATEESADNVEEEALEIQSKTDYEKDNRRYPPISYIDQKFRNMRHQFPQVEPITEITEDVKMLLRLMASKGYTENDIKETIAEFQKKKSAGENSEAAQLLLLAAASESRYAQLLLARELFKGEVIVADYPESFTQINRLAEHDYPEAICDLAQLYEYGYGIKKDKKTATLLYEEAAQMGVARAQKHVERLTSKKGLLSLFKR